MAAVGVPVMDILLPRREIPFARVGRTIRERASAPQADVNGPLDSAAPLRPGV